MARKKNRQGPVLLPIWTVTCLAMEPTTKSTASWEPICRLTKEKKGMYFAVWAPHATSVSLVCDRNKWLPEANPMKLFRKPPASGKPFIPGHGLRRTVQIRHCHQFRQGAV